MIRITAISKVTLFKTDIRYTVEWNNTERYGVINEISEKDALSLLENNSYQLEVRQDDDAGKVEKYYFD